MTAASAFGDADFDRQARNRIAIVRNVEKFPQARTAFVQVATLRPVRFLLSWAVNTVSAMVCSHLHRRARLLHDSAAWFDAEYLAYFSAVAAESRIPTDAFMYSARELRASNLAAIASCDDSVKALRTLNPNSKIAAALDVFAAEAGRLEIVVDKYLLVGQTAHAAKSHMQKSRLQHLELNRQLAGYYEDHNDVIDPQLIAAAEAAMQRIKART